MSYKPKFCCQCGEKIERANWRMWTNRRFCELCETDFGLYDWISTGVLTVGLLLAIVGIGNFWRKPEKNLVVSSNQISADSRNSDKSSAVPSNSSPQNSNPANVQLAARIKESNNSAPTKLPTAAFKQNEKGGQYESQTASAREVVYFCGAQTKKGTICTHRVRNAGRCWQHIGQPAMLPQDKLIASR